MREVIRWLFLESEGITRTDNIMLFSAKVYYFAMRILLRAILGKERRDRYYIEHNIDFGVVLFKKFFHYRDRAKLLRFKSKKYDYEFYCRNNTDDFKLMAFHEDEILDHFKPVRGDTVVDIGAHIGHYSLISSKRVGPEGKVIAIEAAPDNFSILNKNIILNHLENVVSLNCAAYSEKSQVRLYIFQQHLAFSKYNTIIPSRAESGEEYIEVQSDTLDNLLYNK